MPPALPTAARLLVVVLSSVVFLASVEARETPRKRDQLEALKEQVQLLETELGEIRSEIEEGRILREQAEARAATRRAAWSARVQELQQGAELARSGRDQAVATRDARAREAADMEQVVHCTRSIVQEAGVAGESLTMDGLRERWSACLERGDVEALQPLPARDVAPLEAPTRELDVFGMPMEVEG